jgi:Fe-S-cluster-containing dehydrogenase component
MKIKLATFNFHPELCVGCGSCVTTCLDANDVDLSVGLPLRRLLKKESARGGRISITYYSVACTHCPDAPCAAVCPNGCYAKDPETGATVFRAENCVGCGRCARRCPYGAIAVTNRRAAKCDGCLALLREEIQPLCVAACPRRAITIDDRGFVLAKGREELAKGSKTAQPYL